MTSIGGSMPTYDANGNVLNDFLHTYAWDADGHPTTIDAVLVTYDALDRMVERNNTGTFSEIAYAPDGTKLEIMNGQSGGNAFAPLPGALWPCGPPAAQSSTTAIPTTSAVHGSHPPQPAPCTTTGAYASFGQPYAQTGSTDLSFTGMNQDTVSNLYDFPAREYGIQGRWASRRSHATTAPPSNDATCRSSAPPKAQTVSLGS